VSGSLTLTITRPYPVPIPVMLSLFVSILTTWCEEKRCFLNSISSRFLGRDFRSKVKISTFLSSTGRLYKVWKYVGRSPCLLSFVGLKSRSARSRANAKSVDSRCERNSCLTLALGSILSSPALGVLVCTSTFQSCIFDIFDLYTMGVVAVALSNALLWLFPIPFR